MDPFALMVYKCFEMVIRVDLFITLSDENAENSYLEQKRERKCNQLEETANVLCL